MSARTLSSASAHAHGEPHHGGFFAYHGIWAPGVRLFRSLGFAAKALLIVLAMVVPLLGLIGWQVKGQYDQSMRTRVDATRQHVEIARGLLVWAQSQEASGAMPRDQAQQMAMKAIKQLRYDKDQYFWINDMQMRMVMHAAKPDLDGKDVGSMKDPNGFALFQTFVDTVRTQGQGLVTYEWPKPGSDKPVGKISYVMGFEPWGWVIGTGVYVDDITAAFVSQALWSSIVIGLVVLVAAYLFLSFYRVMDGGLKETRRHLRAITHGDLTTSPSPWGKDEAADLMHELREMQGSLRQMVQRVRGASVEIVHSSSEIASGAMDLSGRTEQAAANLQETAASMEEISSTVRSATDHTSEASEVASHNAQIASEGGRVMNEVVVTMDAIRASSAKIAEIISTIDGIAFQTNILALNAAVEAARAGEQGRGFAVVASEVRTLAQRSAGAAKEIKTILVRSVEEVETGTTIVRKAGSTIEDIVSSSQRMNQLLGEVTVGAREQNLGIEQIGQAVNELDRVTQQNAALVEQTAAAAAAMKDQAHALADEVARFKLPEGFDNITTNNLGHVNDFDFDKAIEAHRHWKVKLRKAIAEHEHLDADTICRDDQCPLGKWVHGPGGAQWGARPTFVALVTKHAQFHREAGGVARKINARQYEDAERLIGSGSAFANVSTEVTTLLTQAKRGL
jgi:methyl-accepting chemotaxis protein